MSRIWNLGPPWTVERRTRGFDCRLCLSLRTAKPLIHALQGLLGSTLGEVVQVVVVLGNLHQPLTTNGGDSANVILGGEHEFVVENPLWLVVQTRGRMQCDHLSPGVRNKKQREKKKQK